MASHRIAKPPAIAIVGGESLLGKEVREVLDSSKISANVKLIASSDDIGSILTKQRGEPAVISPLQSADLNTAKLVFLAGSPESSRKAYEQVQNATPPPVAIDLAGALEDQPAARLRAPMVEPPEHPIQVIAHPAAIALALFLIQLRKAGPIRRSVAQIFEPASERGQRGLSELQQQTVGLLSLKKLEQEVFDAQLGFNMLPQYGSEALESLQEIELKIDRHLASLLSKAGLVPMPSLRLVQAPVFHGYSISVWVEFEENPGTDAIVQALASSAIEVRAKNEEAPTNAGVAGQSGITIGAIAPDRNQPRACWFWLVADNLRIAAENALEVARAALH